MPVISLSTDAANLFDYNIGIYELGPNAVAAQPNYGANFWENWEREVHVEYFDDNDVQGFEQDLGVKIFGGQGCISGNIIVRQRGTKHKPGEHVGCGKDHTLYALIDGTVKFTKKKDNKSYVSIVPFEA